MTIGWVGLAFEIHRVRLGFEAVIRNPTEPKATSSNRDSFWLLTPEFLAKQPHALEVTKIWLSFDLQGLIPWPEASSFYSMSTPDLIPRLPAKRTLLDAMSDAFVMTDARRRIVFVNSAFERMCGYTLDEVRWKRPKDILQGAETESWALSSIRRSLQAAKPCSAVLTNYRKGGDAYRVALRIFPMFDDSDQLEGFFAVEREVKESDDYIHQLEDEMGLLYGMVLEMAPQVDPKEIFR